MTIQTDQPLDSEQFLIGAGLLPDTNHDNAAMSPNPGRLLVSALEPHYERVMHALAGEVAELHADIGVQLDRRYEIQRQAGKLHTAIRWLRDVYEFDDLTLRVIAHVLDEDSES